MPDYRLSEAAKQDLILVAQYGDEHFGIVQSDRYRDQLKKRFSLRSGSTPIVERPTGLLNSLITFLETR